MPYPRRKPHHLPAEFYLGRRLYFLTICAAGRKTVFRRSGLVSCCLDALRATCVAHPFQVYAYCFMPDHLHLVLIGLHDSASLPQMIRTFKGRTAAAARALGVSKLWQKGYYDHMLRDGEALNAIARYVWENPVRAGLVADPFAWPYSGSFVLNWKKIEKPVQPFRPPWKPGS